MRSAHRGASGLTALIWKMRSTLFMLDSTMVKERINQLRLPVTEEANDKVNPTAPAATNNHIDRRQNINNKMMS